MNDFLPGVTSIAIDVDTYRLFGRHPGRLRSLGQMVGGVDLLIGASALQHNLTVLTNNRRHLERIEGLSLSSLY